VKTVLLSLEPPVTLLSQIDGPKGIADYISARREFSTHEHTISKELTVLRMALQLARSRHEFGPHWDDLLPGGFSSGYEPQLTFLTPDELNLVMAELLPDHAARAAFMVATSAEWSASVRAQRSDLELVPVPVRGSKRVTRDRKVPVVTPWQRELLAYAKEHAEGKGGALFLGDDTTAFNHALYRACDAVSARPVAVKAPLPRVSANDLRRTFGMWMRAQGVAVAEIALMMGHRDSRMAEKVYARIPAELLQALLQSLVCQPAADRNSGKVGHMGQMGNEALSDSEGLAPRAGFEPATYGLTVTGRNWATPRNDRRCRRTAQPIASRLPGLRHA
jgi:integrase